MVLGSAAAIFLCGSRNLIKTNYRLDAFASARVLLMWAGTALIFAIPWLLKPFLRRRGDTTPVKARGIHCANKQLEVKTIRVSPDTTNA
jgi:hypothetical protein